MAGVLSCHSCGEGLSGVVWRGGRLRAAQSSGQRYYRFQSRLRVFATWHCPLQRVGGRDGKPTVAFIRPQPHWAKEAKGHPGGEAAWTVAQAASKIGGRAREESRGAWLGKQLAAAGAQAGGMLQM